jgi:hypothetical protein
VVLNAPPMTESASGHPARWGAKGFVFVVSASTPLPMVQRAIDELGRSQLEATILVGMDGL